MIMSFLKKKFWDFKYKNFTEKEWQLISYRSNMQIDFAKNFQNQLYWQRVSQSRQSESFIRAFQDEVDWNIISRCQKLSEEFIEEFADKVDWDYIGCHNISESFIEKFANKLNWTDLFNFSLSHKNLSRQFVKKHSYKIPYDCFEPIYFFKKEISWRMFL